MPRATQLIAASGWRRIAALKNNAPPGKPAPLGGVPPSCPIGVLLWAEWTPLAPPGCWRGASGFEAAPLLRFASRSSLAPGQAGPRNRRQRREAPRRLVEKLRFSTAEPGAPLPGGPPLNGAAFFATGRRFKSASRQVGLEPDAASAKRGQLGHCFAWSQQDGFRKTLRPIRPAPCRGPPVWAGPTPSPGGQGQGRGRCGQNQGPKNKGGGPQTKGRNFSPRP